MKAIKYILVGALLLGFAAPTMAQQNEKVIADRVSQVINNKGTDFEKQVNQLYKDNKKDAQALLAIAKAFYNAKDLTMQHSLPTMHLHATVSSQRPIY